MRDFPITLPSLVIAVIRIPVPMDEQDYDALISALSYMKDALLKNPAQDAEVVNETQP